MPEFSRAGLSDQAIEELENRPASIAEVIDRRVAADPQGIGWKYPDVSERWVEVTWTEFRDWVHQVGAGLLALGAGEERRVAIMANTRIEWIVADLANNVVGGASTTIYPNSNPDDVGYILADSDSTIAIVENTVALEKMRASGEFERLRHVVVLDGEVEPDERILSWGELERRGAQLLSQEPDAVKRAGETVGPDTLATLIYTSGTTGRPKGVELTHDNWIFQAVSMATLHLLSPSDVHYLWLPMSHVFGKDLVVIDIYHGTSTAVDGRIDKIVPNLEKVKPTIMCGAPRIFEKVRAAVLTGSPRSGIKGKISRWAFAVGRDANAYRAHGLPMPRALGAKYKVADKLVYSKLRAKLGGNTRLLVSGSAKLSPQVQQWFYSAGITIQEGYGMTETTAIAFFAWPERPRFGTVGQICPGNEVKIAEDGEILLRGPSITRGYHGLDEVNAEAFDAEGFLRTGDVGVLDVDGFLTITDRKKDLMKTSGGKYVSPQEVESVMAANIPYASAVVAVGEGRKYVSLLVTLDQALLEKWAKKRNIDKPYAELTQLPEIRASVQKLVDRGNTHLKKWETVKRFAILDHELTVDSGNMTPNMKVRRRAVAQEYAAIVESLYDADVEDE